MASKALSSIKSALSSIARLRFMSPWKITGVASGSEFRPYLYKTDDFRAVAPGSQSVRAVTPQADPDLVYNIKYWTRDTRRAHMLVGGTNQMEVVSQKVDLSKGVDRPEGLPPLPGVRHRWSKPRPYLDVENNGWT